MCGRLSSPKFGGYHELLKITEVEETMGNCAYEAAITPGIFGCQLWMAAKVAVHGLEGADLEGPVTDRTWRR